MNYQQTAKHARILVEAPKVIDTTLAAFIWKNAEDLWGDFKHTDFGKIILPFTLLRRLECVLEPTRDAVRKAHAKFKDKGLDTDLILRQTAGLPFYNTSLYSLATLGATKTKSNLEAYVAGFSDNARVIFEQFNFTDTIARLARADILFKICQNFANTDLHPDVVPDRMMSNIYEHLIRRFGAEVKDLPRSAKGIEVASPCPVADRCVISAILNDTRDLALSLDVSDQLRLLKSLGHWSVIFTSLCMFRSTMIAAETSLRLRGRAEPTSMPSGTPASSRRRSGSITRIPPRSSALRSRRKTGGVGYHRLSIPPPLSHGPTNPPPSQSKPHVHILPAEATLAGCHDQKQYRGGTEVVVAVDDAYLTAQAARSAAT